MDVMLRVRPATAWNGESIYVCSGEDFETPIAVLIPVGVGYHSLKSDQSENIVRAILEQMDERVFEIEGAVEDFKGRKPDYLRVASGDQTGAAGGLRVRGSSSLPSEVPRNEHGEVIVPPRLKVETPEYKRTRRALRSLRNKEREAKEASRR